MLTDGISYSCREGNNLCKDIPAGKVCQFFSTAVIPRVVTLTVSTKHKTSLLCQPDFALGECGLSSFSARPGRHIQAETKHARTQTAEILWTFYTLGLEQSNPVYLRIVVFKRRTNPAYSVRFCDDNLVWEEGNSIQRDQTNDPLCGC